jgi:transcriptional regulator with XRE-family HTH domain
MAFAQNFSYCLDQMGLSPYAFAQIIGVSNQGVLNWKKGVSIPYPKTQQKIANYFGITVEALMGDELPVLPPEGAKKAPDPEIEGGSQAKKALMDALNDLTDEQCEKLLPIVLSAKAIL